MSPIQKLTACTWPNCKNTPSGAWCSRCRKRVQRLGLPTGTDQLPDEETLSHLDDMWASRPAVTQSAAMAPCDLGDPLCAVARMVGADPDGSEADILKAVASTASSLVLRTDEVRLLAEQVARLQGALEDSRLACSQRIEERDRARRELADARAALVPRFAGSTESLTGDVQALLAYVRCVEEEGGHYALLCQHAHDELDRAGARAINNMGGGTPAERIRLLVADHTAPKPTDMVQTQPKLHPWLDEVTAGSLVLTPRDVKIAKRSIDALCDDNDMTDITFIADVLRVVLHLDEVAHG